MEVFAIIIGSVGLFYVSVSTIFECIWWRLKNPGSKGQRVVWYIFFNLFFLLFLVPGIALGPQCMDKPLGNVVYACCVIKIVGCLVSLLLVWIASCYEICSNEKND